MLIFASGVSNSRETKAQEFEREQRLITTTIEKNPSLLFVYFSTCSVYDETLKQSMYVQHKLAMEKLIQENCSRYMILRLPQVVGKTKSPTIVNFFAECIKKGTEFVVFSKSRRNLIDVDDVAEIAEAFIHDKKFHNKTINVAASFDVSVIEIVRELENILGKSGNFKSEDSGGIYKIDNEITESILDRTSVKFSPRYYVEVLRKYYS